MARGAIPETGSFDGPASDEDNAPISVIVFARTCSSLASWMGPWSDPQRFPGGVLRRTIEVPAPRPFRAWIYRPRTRRVVGGYLIAPGLHFLGPADPRLDRFCRILAASGIEVCAPFLPDYLEQFLRVSALEDFRRAMEAFTAAGGPDRPGILSLSFGSLLALRLAAHSDWSERIAGVVLYGGYCDYRSVIRFSLEGARPGRPHDPLNRPAIYMNLLKGIPGAPKEADRLVAAWRRYMRATWGRPEMKADGRYQAVAGAIATEVPAQDRRLFLQGCGVEEGGPALIDRAVEVLGEELSFLDPRPYLGSIRRPVSLIHSAQDDVIPVEHAYELFRLLPRRVDPRLYVTGMWGHTSSVGLRGLLRLLPRIAGEVRSMTGALSALARNCRWARVHSHRLLPYGPTYPERSAAKSRG